LREATIVQEGGLGLLSGAFVGAITFALNFAIAYHIPRVPGSYWGRFGYPQAVGMAVLTGTVCGGFFGLLGGTVAVPLISLYMGF